MNPRSVFTAAVLAIGACGGATTEGGRSEGEPGAPSVPRREPTKIGQPGAPAGQAVPFQILVSNQSFAVSPVDIDVYLDGVHAISGDFEVGSQHTWIPFDFELASGEHTLRVVSAKGNASAEEPFTLGETKRWSIVMFWASGAPASFTIDLRDQQPAFM